ncbi:hypothetical protein QIS74_03009 [Colletotrichum tabaci]|uniref:Uncharacterized protein n=1 Tax=Colletotrichum tabaci TaxID=1209068 RepID=A0AAV9TMK1_9PEZI
MKTTSLFHVAAAVVLLRLANADASTSACSAPYHGIGPRILHLRHQPVSISRAPAGSGRTATAGIEKQWRCRLGSSSDEQEILDQCGVCFVTTVNAAGSRTVGPGMLANTCFSEAHSVVVAFTAGL